MSLCQDELIILRKRFAERHLLTRIVSIFAESS